MCVQETAAGTALADTLTQNYLRVNPLAPVLADASI